MTNNQNLPSPQYSSLEELRQRKEELRGMINADQQRAATLWKELFHKPSQPTGFLGGGGQIVKTSMGIIDGMILGWKLWRKFKGR